MPQTSSQQLRGVNPKQPALGYQRIIGYGIAFFFGSLALFSLLGFRFAVDGISMMPSLAENDFLLVSRAPIMFGEPSRGELWVFRPIEHSTETLIKRVIGLPSETVEFRESQVYIDGRLLEEPYMLEACTSIRCPDSLWQVGQNAYFVLGDNRNNSQDSRRFGTIPKDQFLGVALIRYWPLRNIGWIHRIGFPEWKN